MSLTAVLLGGAFAGALLLMMFLLWASGRSERVRLTGALAWALFQAALASSELWNRNDAHGATFWKVIVAVLLLSAAGIAYRIFRTFGRSDQGVDPFGATRP
jgi:hypothetical protein